MTTTHTRSVFTEDDLAIFRKTEPIVHQHALEGRPNSLFNFWKEKHKLYLIRVGADPKLN